MSQDIFACPNVHTYVCRHTLVIQWVGTMEKHRTTSTTRNFPILNVNRDNMINPTLDSKSVAKQELLILHF